MTSAPPLKRTEDSANDLLSDIHVLANLTARAFSGQLDDLFGMSVPEWRVLLALARHPGSTAAEITNRWAMDKMAISRAIQRLEGDGHIGRDRNPSDRRSYKLSLSASGEALHQKILPTANKRYREFVSCLTREELGSFHNYLKKLIDHAGDMSG